MNKRWKGVRGMNKYFEIIKINLKTQLIWRADVAVNMLLTISKILFAYLLWGIIFDGKEHIAGFTYSSMLSYYIISSFLSQLDMSSRISEEITQRIRNGTFSKYMTIPVNIMGYFVAMEIGTIVFYFGFDLIAAVLWVYVFRINFVLTTDCILLLSAVILIVLGLIFMIQLNYLLGILTLKFEEISTFLMIKDNLLALITGTIIPLTLLPESIIDIMKFLPFYYVTYLPTMLLLGQNANEAVSGIVIMVAWCFAFVIINRVTYQTYRVKFDGAGL